VLAARLAQLARVTRRPRLGELSRNSSEPALAREAMVLDLS
jgi:hypothetical protein